MDLIMDGRRFGSDKAHGEAARCLPLLRMYGARLQAQGIGPELALELHGHDETLTRRDRELAEAKKRAEDATDAIEVMMSTGIDLSSRAWSYAVKTFKSTDAGMLAGFPPRAGILNSVDKMVRCLNDVSNFVATHETAMIAAGTPAGFGREVSRRVEALIEADRILEDATQAADTAALAVFLACGEIYRICGRVYAAGRAEYRLERDLRMRFRFEHMVATGDGLEDERDDADLTQWQERRPHTRSGGMTHADPETDPG